MRGFPLWTIADAYARENITLGYCRDLAGHARRLGMQVLRSELLLPVIDRHNPTAITVIAKRPEAAPAEPRWWMSLQPMVDGWYSADSLLAYPCIGGIPCLAPEHGVIAGRLRRAMGAV